MISCAGVICVLWPLLAVILLVFAVMILIAYSIERLSDSPSCSRLCDSVLCSCLVFCPTLASRTAVVDDESLAASRSHRLSTGKYSGVVGGGGGGGRAGRSRSLLKNPLGDSVPSIFTKKSMSFSIRYYKKLIDFKGYSLIHSHKTIHFNSMHLICCNYAFC